MKQKDEIELEDVEMAIIYAVYGGLKSPEIIEKVNTFIKEYSDEKEVIELLQVALNRNQDGEDIFYKTFESLAKAYKNSNS